MVVTFLRSEVLQDSPEKDASVPPAFLDCVNALLSEKLQRFGIELQYASDASSKLNHDTRHALKNIGSEIDLKK